VEIVALEPSPKTTLLRGTKLLGTGGVYSCRLYFVTCIFYRKGWSSSNQ